jgi:hypothetical protein
LLVIPTVDRLVMPTVATTEAGAAKVAETEA